MGAGADSGSAPRPRGPAGRKCSEGAGPRWARAMRPLRTCRPNVSMVIRCPSLSTLPVVWFAFERRHREDDQSLGSLACANAWLAGINSTAPRSTSSTRRRSSSSHAASTSTSCGSRLASSSSASRARSCGGKACALVVSSATRSGMRCSSQLFRLFKRRIHIRTAPPNLINERGLIVATRGSRPAMRAYPAGRPAASPATLSALPASRMTHPS